MSKQEVPIIFQNTDPGVGEHYDVDERFHVDDVSQSPVDVTVHVDQRRPGRIRRGIRNVGVMAVAGLAALGAWNAYEMIDGFGVDATQETDVTVGPAKSVVHPYQYVNLTSITSRFPLSVKTSLDRLGPSNCDMNIVMTQENEQVQTTTNTGVVFEQFATSKGEDGRYSIKLMGSMLMTPASIDWLETPILFERDLGLLDACFNMDEPNRAMDIAVTTTLQAGRLAAACAVDSEPGVRALEASIKDHARMIGDIPKEVVDEDIDVLFENLEEQQDELYDEASDAFDDVVNGKIEEYLDESDDHRVHTNFTGIKDCSKHEFEFAEQ